jgi:hypothetical protein
MVGNTTSNPPIYIGFILISHPFILAGKHSEWLRINYGDNCGICGGYSHIIHAGLTDSWRITILELWHPMQTEQWIKKQKKELLYQPFPWVNGE